MSGAKLLLASPSGVADGDGAIGNGLGFNGGRFIMRIVVAVAAALALLAFLPYDFDTMGWDVRLLLLANP